MRDSNETIIRWANTSKPAFGGISFYIILLISFASYSIFFDAQEILRNKEVLGLFITATMAFLMGLADDAYNTKPFLKFIIQLLCGCTLCICGIHIVLFQYAILNYIFTILWIAGIMNSINMLDNMDSIATIVSIMIFASVAVLIYSSNTIQNNIHLLILTGLIGSLAGFLILNWHPSKLYMGDTGSQLLGLMLAAFGILYFWNVIPSSGNITGSISKQLMVVLIGFILPITDTSVVVINRIASKKSPFVGGKDHTTHHLFFRGITEKRIAILFAAIGLLSLLIIYYITIQLPKWDATWCFIFFLFPLSVFITLLTITRTKKQLINQSDIQEAQESQEQSGFSIGVSSIHVKKDIT